MLRKMKVHHVFLPVIVLLLLIGVCYMLWPHSFANLQPECDSITLYRIDTAGDGISFTAAKETYLADSAEFGQVMEYPFALHLPSFLPDAGRREQYGRQSCWLLDPRLSGSWR